MKSNLLEDRIIKFAARCVKVCGVLPVRKVGSSSLADQLFRSATSVAANYAEGCQSESRKDFVHKLKIAVKELYEARTWLKIVAESEYVTKSRMADVIQESEELAAILGASITTARKNMVTPTLA